MTREEAREELIAFKDKSWDGMPDCKHYGEDLHGANCRFCQDMKLWEVKENG